MLAEKYTLRSQWTKNQKRGQIPKAKAPRQVAYRDTVHYGNIAGITEEILTA